MAEPSRGVKISRRGWLLASLAVPLFRARASDSLIVTYDGDNLHVSSFGVHFLKGNSLKRLKEGATVEYVAQISLFHDQFVTQFKRSEFRFQVSYDIWGATDQFTVTTAGSPTRRQTNLSLSGAETWCLEHAAVSAAGIPQDRYFWLQLELRAVPPKLKAIGDKSINLDLVEIFSPGADERQVFTTSSPLRLMDMKHGGRGRAG